MGINLFLKQGDDYSIEVEAENRFIDNVITEVKSGKLHIYYSKKSSLIRTVNHSKINVYVTVTRLDLVEVSSGANLFCEQRLKLEKLKVITSSGADARIDVECRDLTLTSSSGSDITAFGSTIYLIANSSSGSDINARALEAVFANLTASSGSDLVAYITGEIEINTSSGGAVTYYGNAIPKVIRQSSGGSVRKQ
jgi:hypothetical protein